MTTFITLNSSPGVRGKFHTPFPVRRAEGGGLTGTFGVNMYGYSCLSLYVFVAKFAERYQSSDYKSLILLGYWL